MVYKNGKCRLVGFVDLGNLHDNMTTLTGIRSPNSACVIVKYVANDQMPANTQVFNMLVFPSSVVSHY